MVGTFPGFGPYVKSKPKEPESALFEVEPSGGMNSIPITHFPLGLIDALEHISVPPLMNGPLKVGAAPICTLAVLLSFVIVTSF